MREGVGDVRPTGTLAVWVLLVRLQRLIVLLVAKSGGLLLQLLLLVVVVGVRGLGICHNYWDCCC